MNIVRVLPVILSYIALGAHFLRGGEGVVVVTDMFGGSPSNLSLMACAAGAGRRIVYGANLPMLIKLAKSRHMPVNDAVSAALDAGRKYINSLDLGSEA